MLRNLPQGWAHESCWAPTKGKLLKYEESYKKFSSFTMFFPSHRQLWMKKDGRKIALLSDKWQDGITPRATHQQTAATEETDVNKSPPPAVIYQLSHLTKRLQSSLWEGTGATLAVWGYMMKRSRVRRHLLPISLNLFYESGYPSDKWPTLKGHCCIILTVKW